MCSSKLLAGSVTCGRLQVVATTERKSNHKLCWTNCDSVYRQWLEYSTKVLCAHSCIVILCSLSFIWSETHLLYFVCITDLTGSCIHSIVRLSIFMNSMTLRWTLKHIPQTTESHSFKWWVSQHLWYDIFEYLYLCLCSNTCQSHGSVSQNVKTEEEVENLATWEQALHTSNFPWYCLLLFQFNRDRLRLAFLYSIVTSIVSLVGTVRVANQFLRALLNQ